jgi:multicomponent Na+:H+ antiporter subunit D
VSTVIAPLLIPLSTALLATLLSRRARLQRVVSLVGGLALLGSAIALQVEVASAGVLRVTLGGWPFPMGITLVADSLSALMIGVTALMGVCSLVFQLSDARPAPPAPVLHPLIHMMLAAVCGAFITGDLFNLYVWFELMLAAALGLLVYGSTVRQLDATFKYFILNALGTLFLLMGIAYLHAITGHLSFGALAAVARDGALDPFTPIVVMIGFAFLVKAAAFPLFAWLPASYHTLPAPILALFAGLLTKVGVYALLRLFGDVFSGAPDLLYGGLRWIAAATMVVGVLGAAYHWDIRRILAFHIVSQIGYMLLGIALDSEAGKICTIFYTVHHIVVKANLFFIAALICRYSGSYDLRRAGGLYARRPLLAVLFAIPALSLVGIPPLSGFWAKLLLVRETLAQGYFVLAGVTVLVGILTLYSMTKIWLEAFWKRNPDETRQPTRDARLGPAYLTTGALAVITVTLGLFPEQLLDVAVSATTQFMGAP